jgi:hypothetical protein
MEDEELPPEDEIMRSRWATYFLGKGALAVERNDSSGLNTWSTANPPTPVTFPSELANCSKPPIPKSGKTFLFALGGIKELW